MLSETAMAAVRVATAQSPARAQMLLNILRTAARAVKRKPDRYGPLGFVLLGHAPVLVERRRLFERFAEEWQRGDFGPGELAEALEEALNEVTGRRQRPGRWTTGWRTLAGRPHGRNALIQPLDRHRP